MHTLIAKNLILHRGKMIIFDRGDSAQTRRSIAGAQTFTFPPMLPPGLAEACRMVRFRRSENPKKHRIHVARGAFRYPTRFRPHAGSGNGESPATGHVEHPLHSLTEQGGPDCKEPPCAWQYVF
ncbi:MAG TPA: hypothetical protein VIM62_11565 [Acidobacteriaceae bacterium]